MGFLAVRQDPSPPCCFARHPRAGDKPKPERGEAEFVGGVTPSTFSHGKRKSDDGERGGGRSRGPNGLSKATDSRQRKLFCKTLEVSCRCMFSYWLNGFLSGVILTYIATSFYPLESPRGQMRAGRTGSPSALVGLHGSCCSICRRAWQMVRHLAVGNAL